VADDDAIDAALKAHHRSYRLLSGREAGGLVELVRPEADDDDMGTVITTMTPRDLDDDALAARRLERRREGTCERMRKLRAKCVTKPNVTIPETRPERYKPCDASSRRYLQRHADVTNSLSDGVITASDVSAALGVAAGAARVRLHRAFTDGALIRVGRGRYAIRVEGGGLAALPTPPAPGRETASHADDQGGAEVGMKPRARRHEGSTASRLLIARAALAGVEARVGLGPENSRYLWEPAGTHGWGYPRALSVFPQSQIQFPLPDRARTQDEQPQ
jgi:hypothetical protein